jgi:dTDP-4-dehydrorhamnose 3,5-epimerase
VRFSKTTIDGVVTVDLERIEDERGYFARAWCSREFAEHGLTVAFVQENVGFSPRRGTLRGLHYQRNPWEEVKLVRCVRGAVWDVALDLRSDSASFGEWFGVELSAENGRMLVVPEGCAHGYLTLTDDVDLRYLTSQYYEPDAAAGARFDDPAFSIEWPGDVRMVSGNDRSWPLWAEQ